MVLGTNLARGPISRLLALPIPRRSDRKHNIASVLKKRSVTDVPSTQSTPAHVANSPANDATLATAVMSKIEDGNIKAAILILSSEDKLASDCKQTVLYENDTHVAHRRGHPSLIHTTFRPVL